MGWANDTLTNDFARVGIFPLGSSTSNSRSVSSNSSSYAHYTKEKQSQPQPKRKVRYYNYDFPTEAQIRALNFITTYTGVVFEGKTKKEAIDFIGEYMDYAKEEKEE